MSIKNRLLAAFLLVLALTTAVATVGWIGLRSYAARVNVAASAKTLEVVIANLGLVADRAVASGDPAQLALGSEMAKVRDGILNLRAHVSDDGGMIDRVQGSVDTFRRDLDDYAAHEREEAALIARRTALIDAFESVAHQIATAQADAYRAAAGSAKVGHDALIAAVTTQQLTPFLQSSVDLLKDAITRYGFGDTPENAKAVDLAAARVAMLTTGLSHRPAAAKSAADMLAANTAAREALKDPANAKARLPEFLATIEKGAQEIQSKFNERLSSAITEYNDEQFKLANATSFRETALEVEELAVRARMAEQALVYKHDPAAAQSILDVANAIEKTSLELVYQVADPTTEKKIRSLIGQISDYKAGLNRVLAEQEKQKALLEEVMGATRDAIHSAKLLTDQQLAAMNHEHQRADLLLGLGVGIALVAGLAFAIIIGRGITGPLHRLTEVMTRLAAGDKTVEIPGRDRRDELREVAAAVAIFRDNALAMDRMTEEHAAAETRAQAEKREAVRALAGDLDKIVTTIVNSISNAAQGLQTTATGLTSTADNTHRQAASATDASGTAQVSVQAVASAAEELSASIQEISRQALSSAEIAARAVNNSTQSNARVSELSEAAEKIETIVSLIQDIASRTNLLALNATIEAARAGEAGKGFAVVASEVKQLAKQTASATADIAVQINAIQQATQDAVAGIAETARTISEMGQITAAISTSVEQQGQATSEIVRNIHDAASGAATASSNIAEVSLTARQTGNAADAVLSAAGTMVKDSEHLRGEVQQFIRRVVNG